MTKDFPSFNLDDVLSFKLKLAYLFYQVYLINYQYQYLRLKSFSNEIISNLFNLQFLIVL